MTDASVHTSEELEKGSTNSVQKNGGTDVRHTTVNPEYSRYLDLHAQFEGEGRRKLLKKRTFSSQDLTSRSCSLI